MDCSTLTHETEQFVLTKASHIAWVLPATQGGLRRASRVLEAITANMAGREIVIARRDLRERQAPLSDVKALAADRGATLILVPQLPDLTETVAAAALDNGPGGPAGDPRSAAAMTGGALAPILPGRPEAMGRTGAPGTAALAMRVAGGLLAVIAVVAVLVRIAGGEAARGWLAYPFTGVPATADQAAAIFAHNLRALGGIIGLLLITQAAAHQPGGPARVQQVLRTAGEAVLAGVVVANVLVVGAALGAYEARMVRAMLPHGPVELAGFATAFALYLEGRDRVLPLRQLLLTGTASVLMLGAGAVLEVLVVV